MLLSDCCTAPPDYRFSADYEDGICSECGEHSEFLDDDIPVDNLIKEDK